MNALEPAKGATTCLSKDGISMLDSETAITFLLNKLQELDTPMARHLHEAIYNRFEARRNSIYTSLILYLQHPDLLEINQHFGHPSFKEMNALAVRLMERFFGIPQHQTTEHQVETVPTASSSEDNNFYIQLKDRIEAARCKEVKASEKSIDYKKEMTNYAKLKVRTPILDKLLEGLLTIQATSVASERTFSNSGSFVTKKRSSLSDQSVNALVFLKHYFKDIDSNVNS